MSGPEVDYFYIVIENGQVVTFETALQKHRGPSSEFSTHTYINFIH